MGFEIANDVRLQDVETQASALAYLPGICLASLLSPGLQRMASCAAKPRKYLPRLSRWQSGLL